ncbi:phosphotransferase [Cellulomonas sp. NS3]|uniref:phosphotransferase n=1 Tax=Cellulomonas sp. NS3 TaxID=2973977 RepID=UPI002162C1A6|nr:phosphotransferase [Cellulomonas sp. NS3]
MSSLPPVSDEPPGPLLARGREATVHELGPGRVLRRYDDARDVTAEVTVMRHVARHGVRVPHVHGLHLDARGRPTGMVLERLDGPTLVEAALVGDVEPAEAGRTLARLHADLHRVPVDGLPADLGPPAREPGHVVVHLDLHPANVMLVAGEPVVIDWAIARTGPATLDTAMTALAIACAVVEGIPADAGDVARLDVPPWFVTTVLDAYLAALPEPPTTSLDRAVAVRDSFGAHSPGVVQAGAEVVRLALDAIARR